MSKDATKLETRADRFREKDLASTSMPFKFSLRIPFTIVATAIFSSILQPVLAQAPVNDVVSWPSGLLLLASVLYAALGTAPDRLWEIEPSAGLFLWSGLPKITIPSMQRVNWVTQSCHFVPGIRSAYGKSNFWIRAETVSTHARQATLMKVLSLLRCVGYEPSQWPIDESLWRVTSAGLIATPTLLPHTPTSGTIYSPPSARDFLLFAAIDYHVFRTWEVQIYSGKGIAFSTKGMPPSSVVDVESEEAAVPVVAAQMVRRPHSQSQLRRLAKHEGDDESVPYILQLDSIPRDIPVCSIDFHSYSPEQDKVSASLTELAGAYYRVVQYIKRSSDASDWQVKGEIANVSVGQTLWISILGGALLDKGRLTIQNLPGRWGMKGVSADEAYLTRIDSILQAIEPHANKSSFSDIVVSGGINRRSAYPFLIAGLFGQMIVCYFLSVGTSAGVWTSVALANSLYAGRLTDWHSVYYGKTAGTTDEPGMKMYVPGSKDLMAIATFDRSTPRQGGLRPGFLVNTGGLIAAILGAVFQEKTRDALDFGPFSPTPPWVVYTSVVLCIGTSVLVASALGLQQIREKTWFDDSEMPTRWMIYTTLPLSVTISGLAVFFQVCHVAKFWPVLDALTWVSGFPLGMIENGRMFAADDNMLHLVLLNRWIMGAVASSVGSSQLDSGGVCWRVS